MSCLLFSQTIHLTCPTLGKWIAGEPRKSRVDFKVVWISVPHILAKSRFLFTTVRQVMCKQAILWSLEGTLVM